MPWTRNVVGYASGRGGRGDDDRGSAPPRGSVEDGHASGRGDEGSGDEECGAVYGWARDGPERKGFVDDNAEAGSAADAGGATDSPCHV
jgi:hypothetical protein